MKHVESFIVGLFVIAWVFVAVYLVLQALSEGPPSVTMTDS